jgi:hypothetical protein
MVVRGMSAVPFSMTALNTPSDAANGKPVPLAPRVSMKPSAAAMALPPELVSSNAAVTRTAGVLLLTPSAPLLGFGAATTSVVAGPSPSVARSIVV